MNFHSNIHITQHNDRKLVSFFFTWRAMKEERKRFNIMSVVYGFFPIIFSNNPFFCCNPPTLAFNLFTSVFTSIAEICWLTLELFFGFGFLGKKTNLSLFYFGVWIWNEQKKKRQMFEIKPKNHKSATEIMFFFFHSCFTFWSEKCQSTIFFLPIICH